MPDLIGMYIPDRHSRLGYIKAIIRNEDKEYFEALGFADEIVVWVGPDEPEPPVVAGDKGCGLPGDFSWHQAKIMELRNKKQVSKYIYDAINITLGDIKELSLQATKIKAVKAIKDHSDD